MNPESLSNTNEKELSYTDFQEWCTAMATELSALTHFVTPEEKDRIEQFLVSVNSEMLAQQASFGVDNGESTPAHLATIKAQLIAECVEVLGTVTSVDVTAYSAAVQGRVG